MSDYKTCPLKATNEVGFVKDTNYQAIDVDTGICTEDNCAWWDEMKQCCAVLTIARASRQK